MGLGWLGVGGGDGERVRRGGKEWVNGGWGGWGGG